MRLKYAILIALLFSCENDGKRGATPQTQAQESWSIKPLGITRGFAQYGFVQSSQLLLKNSKESMLTPSISGSGFSLQHTNVNCATGVLPGRTCLYNVLFAPPAISGSFSGVVSFDGGSVEYVFEVKKPAIANLSPAFFNLGTFPSGSMPRFSAIITNVGDSIGVAPTIEGNIFIRGHNCNAGLSPGEMCEVEFEITTPVTGNIVYNASIDIGGQFTTPLQASVNVINSSIPNTQSSATFIDLPEPPYLASTLYSFKIRGVRDSMGNTLVDQTVDVEYTGVYSPEYTPTYSAFVNNGDIFLSFIPSATVSSFGVKITFTNGSVIFFSVPN